jgi:sugar phosphate isomerase/epimerase
MIRGIRDLKISQEEICELAIVAGFEGVDLNIAEIAELSMEKSIEEIKGLRFCNNLRLGAWGLPIRWRESDSNFQKSLEDLDYLASIAEKLSCNRTYTWVQPFSDALSFKDNIKWHVERLRPIAQVLKRHSCSLGLEYVGPNTSRLGHKYEFIHDMKDMLNLIKELGMKNVGLLLDSFHWYAAGETVEDIRNLEPEQVICVHINDAPTGISTENVMDEERRLPGETGTINVVEFLRTLNEIGYDGPITPETFNEKLRNMSTLDATIAAGKALSDLWHVAGLG